MQTVLSSKVAPVGLSTKSVASVQAKAVAPARVCAAPKSFTNTTSTKQMLVWEPVNNK